LIFLVSCSSQSLDDFREEGNEISRQLIIELKQIRSRDDLPQHSMKLQELFNCLVDTILRAEEFRNEHPEEFFDNDADRELTTSDQLRIELNRVMHLEGGREVIEKAQAEALEKKLKAKGNCL